MNMERTIKVKANHSKRTFTIREYWGGKSTCKYRTNPVTKAEFNEMVYMTENDWSNYLRYSNDYHIIVKNYRFKTR